MDQGTRFWMQGLGFKVAGCGFWAFCSRFRFEFRARIEFRILGFRSQLLGISFGYDVKGFWSEGSFGSKFRGLGLG